MKKISLVLAFALAFFGCSDSEIDVVKKASAKDNLLSSIKDANLTVGKAIDGLKACNKAEWKYDEVFNHVKATCELKIPLTKKMINNLAFDTICYFSDKFCKMSYNSFSRVIDSKIKQDEFFNIVKKHCDIGIREIDLIRGGTLKQFTFTCDKSINDDFRKTYKIKTNQNLQGIGSILEMLQENISNNSVLDLVANYLYYGSFEIVFSLADDKKSFEFSYMNMLSHRNSAIVQSEYFLNEMFKDLK